MKEQWKQKRLYITHDEIDFCLLEMETIKNVGQVVISSDDNPLWIIPHFYDLPQEYNTVIRSPLFCYENKKWYIEVYPNGRRLYSSSGWFGISVLNLNADFNFCPIVLGIRGAVKKDNCVIITEESNGDGFYCCAHFLPRLLLQSWKNILAPEGDLHVSFFTMDDDLEKDTMYIQLLTEDVQEWFKEKFEIASIEPCTQVKEGNEILLKTDVGGVFLDSGWDVKWIIPNFWDLPQEYDTVIRSPRFRFKDRDWHIEVYPNGRRTYSSLSWFGIRVWNLNSDSNLHNVQVYVVGENPSKNWLLFKADHDGKGSYFSTRLFPTPLLKHWKDVVAERGNLHLVLDIRNGCDENSANILRMLVARKYMQDLYKKFENRDTFTEASTQTEGEIVKEELKPNFLGPSTAKSTEAEKENGVEKLRQDFREMLLNGSISDIVLKVEGQEFRAHKFILAARSPVFLAMMTHDTKEKISGVVDIPDVDPTVFPDFLNYLYTGSLENLTSENAAKLYTTADKYQVNELKESCKDLMLTNISIDNFCDIFTLSLRHHEKELKEACIQFFSENSLDIVLSCKWQTFLSENPITGNELFIKHLKLSK